MHELALTQDLVDTVLSRTGAARVLRVELCVGQLAPVVPEALRFCFEVCTEGTPMSGAVLQLVPIPGRAACERCGAELALATPYGECGCGSTELRWLSGHELLVREVEIEVAASELSASEGQP